MVILSPNNDYALNGGNARLDGPELPFTLDGHSSQTWIIDATSAPENADTLIMTVRLGHGQLLTATLVRDERSSANTQASRRRARLKPRRESKT